MERQYVGLERTEREFITMMGAMWKQETQKIGFIT
jgi:hypothetical protein